MFTKQNKDMLLFSKNIRQNICKANSCLQSIVIISKQARNFQFEGLHDN